MSVKAVTAAISLLLLQSAYSLIVRASHSGDGKYEYNTRTVVLFSETVKCFISGNMLAWMWSKGQVADIGKVDVKTALLFSIPGLLYFVNNNIPFYCLMYLDPPSYQVLQQLKIGTTAVAFRIVMGRTISSKKWLSLLLLLVGCALSQIKLGDLDGMLHASVIGYALVITQCSISATAAVISEKLLKETNQSIHLQNLQLYLYGVVFSLVNMYAEGVQVSEWVQGYNVWTVASVLCLSLSGLATSAVMKYADNLIKVFALAGSMIFTTVASAMLFGTIITAMFLFGTFFAMFSCYMYFTEGDDLDFRCLDMCGGVCNFAPDKKREPPFAPLRSELNSPVKVDMDNIEKT
eukprot:CAMPEP_0196583482 /NCGR_PEP_ID=MMETSP1081-20130531/43795_1 /TAXON_ID=36882 /ORGANISM="Pyramimonas amylifera, Strain CCMP720" /LENGTH=348 /DNA_ID=CAMNT_0041904391 /DNA_START=247 /DNA_END=1293 /DNA_ORIENTATION=-